MCIYTDKKLLYFESYINIEMLNECCNCNSLVTLINQLTIRALTVAGAFRNGNGYISTSVRQTPLSASAFESSRRALQLASHWHCLNTSYFTKK